MQQLQSFSHYRSIQDVYTCDIAAWSIEACNQAKRHRVSARGKYDRNCVGRRLGSKRSLSTNHDDYGNLAADEIDRQRRKAIVLVLRAAIFDRHVVSLNIADFREASPDGVHAAGVT